MVLAPSTTPGGAADEAARCDAARRSFLSRAGDTRFDAIDEAGEDDFVKEGGDDTLNDCGGGRVAARSASWPSKKRRIGGNETPSASRSIT